MVDRGGVVFDDRLLTAKLLMIDAKAMTAIAAVMAYRAPSVVAYAKQHAPWTDRTSNARNGLYATAERGGDSFRIVLGHGVPYGIWLEVKNSGQYAVIKPTIQNQGPVVMGALSAVLRGIV